MQLFCPWHRGKTGIPPKALGIPNPSTLVPPPVPVLPAWEVPDLCSTPRYLGRKLNLYHICPLNCTSSKTTGIKLVLYLQAVREIQGYCQKMTYKVQVVSKERCWGDQRGFKKKNRIPNFNFPTGNTEFESLLPLNSKHSSFHLLRNISRVIMVLNSNWIIHRMFQRRSLEKLVILFWHTCSWGSDYSHWLPDGCDETL